MYFTLDLPALRLYFALTFTHTMLCISVIFAAKRRSSITTWYCFKTAYRIIEILSLLNILVHYEYQHC